MHNTEGAQPTAGEVRLSDAERRVLTDIAASQDMPPARYMERRFVSSFGDFVASRDRLVKRGLLEVADTIPRITEAGRSALRGAR